LKLLLFNNPFFYKIIIITYLYIYTKENIEKGYYINSESITENETLFKYIDNNNIEYYNLGKGYYWTVNYSPTLGNEYKLRQVISNYLVPVMKLTNGYYWNDKNDVVQCINNTCEFLTIKESSCTTPETLINVINEYKYCIDKKTAISLPYNDDDVIYYPLTTTSTNDSAFGTFNYFRNIIVKFTKYSVSIVTEQSKNIYNNN